MSVIRIRSGLHPGSGTVSTSPIGLYRENAIAIESEASDSLTYVDKSGFARKERNLHCDIHALT